MKKFVSNAEISSGTGSASEIWENIYSKKEWGKYPSEAVIRFIARNFYNAADRNAIKVLELGLGTGANLWFCAREGFRVSGIEFTKSGIEFFQKRMRAENLSDKIDKISQGDYLEKLDEFEDEGFDAIVDVCSLACNDLQKTRQIFAKALKKLKIGGKFYSSTIAAGLWGYEASKGQWQQPTKGIYTDVGKVRFETKQSVQELYKASDFAIQSLLTQTLENDKILDKLYIIEGVKVLDNGGGGRTLACHQFGAFA